MLEARPSKKRMGTSLGLARARTCLASTGVLGRSFAAQAVGDRSLQLDGLIDDLVGDWRP